MKTLLIATLTLILALSLSPAARAQAPEPGSLRRAELFRGERRTTPARAGGGETTQASRISSCSEPDPRCSAARKARPRPIPARLQVALQRRLPGVTVNVVSQAKMRQTTADMVKTLGKLLVDAKPALVLWQTGTADAMRGIDPEDFRSTLDDGVETLQAGNADVVLINMQYSPRTESMIQLGTYADNMRVVARDRDVPLFDRLGLMHYWNDNGTFDLYAAAKDNALASTVHDCLGRALAALVIEAAHLEKSEDKPAQ